MLSSQIEYIVGAKWNLEYNKKRADFYYYKFLFNYHNMSKINWNREIKKLPKRYHPYYVSCHPDLTWNVIQANFEKICSSGISQNPNITLDIIQENPKYPWDWWYISSNPNITWDIIQNNPDYPWEWDWISQNPNITWDIIQANCKKTWNWSWLSLNRNITWDIIQANPDRPWNWRCISANPNITWDIIDAYPDKPWKWDNISQNPNITWDIIQANPDKPWEKCNLFYNKFTAQAKLAMAKHRVTASRMTNYLARYITYSLVFISLEYYN